LDSKNYLLNPVDPVKKKSDLKNYIINPTLQIAGNIVKAVVARAQMDLWFR